MIMTEKEEYKSFMNFVLILYDFFYRIADLFIIFGILKQNPAIYQALC